MGGDMLSIGQIAHTTGVSRRMLRHWEDVGLLSPASVDERTGYRRYAPSQVGRVRAVAALRAVGFGLEAVGDLLGDQLSEQRLIELLRTREHELTEQIDEATARLHEVRTRLTSLHEGRRTMSTLEITPLPELHLAALQTTVGDESEIPDAVTGLLARLREHLAEHGDGDPDILLTYDGSADDAIVVTAGVDATQAPRLHRRTGLQTVVVPGADRGVTARLESRPAMTGDAWATLDAQVAQQGWTTTNVYRQTLTAEGIVVLQAPVRAVAAP